MDIDQLFLKSLTRTASKKELKQLDALLEENPQHRVTLQKLEAFWELKKLGAQSPDEERIWKQLQTKTDTDAMKRGRFFPSLYRYAAIALLLILTTFSWYYFQQPSTDEPVKVVYVTKQNPVRLKRTMTLPDGTKVHLNSESKLTYPKTFLKQRLVSLVGEAYFEVVPDKSKPFIVSCQNTSTIVEGTSFNVRGYEDEEIVKVSLVEGRVSIDFDQNGQTSSYALEPMQEATYSKLTGKVEVNLFNVNEIVSWTTGTLYFHEASFSQVKKKIERWYGVEVVLNGEAPSWNVSGQFENESLQNVMNVLSHAENFNFKINESKVEITL